MEKRIWVITDYDGSSVKCFVTKKSVVAWMKANKSDDYKVKVEHTEGKDDYIVCDNENAEYMFIAYLRTLSH